MEKKKTLNKISLKKNQNVKEYITVFTNPSIDLTEELNSIGIINIIINYK